MPDEDRVFDVTRPGRSNAQATSRPVIVGHLPANTDPMVRDEAGADGSHLESAPTRITVQGGPAEPPQPEPTGDAWGGPFNETVPSNELPTPEFNADPEVPTEIHSSETTFPEVPEPQMPAAQLSQVQGLDVDPPPRKKRLAKTSLIILVLLAGAYIAIDSGLVGSGINLPFHIFKQKSAPPAASTQTPTPSQPAANTVTLPVGFTEYKLAGTSITFAAPTAWGQPNSSPDPGYSIRSATAKSDGSYAYLVDFDTNKGVEIAVTSSKYLPPARGALYYDFLQWCTGTNDSKIYKSLLHFTTVNKVDTPSTTTCDQGPLDDATKLDSSTIVQLKTKDPAGAVLGDLYTKNLTNSDLPVFRVADKTMTNSADIKQLLATVKAPATQ
jgi:hypothetical protein